MATQPANRSLTVAALAAWLILTAALAGAQDKPPHPLLLRQQDAEKKAADWDAVAKTLETRLARMLPCDPRARAAIEEVKAASDARLTAFNQYLQAAAAKTKEDTTAAKRVLLDQEMRLADMDAERTEAELARAGIDVQITGLSGSAKQRPSLGDALSTLREIAAMASARVARVHDHTARRLALAQAFRDLATAAQAVQTSLDDEVTSLRDETIRWNEYYTARLARAQLECAITNQGTGARPPRKKK